MLIALGICHFGFPRLADKGLPPLKLPSTLIAGLLSLLGLSIAAITYALEYSVVVSDVVIIIGILGFAGLLIAAFFEEPAQRYRLWALVILMVFSILFWALYVQMFSSITLFTLRNVNRHVFGYELPPGMFVALNPFFFVFTPVGKIMVNAASSPFAL